MGKNTEMIASVKWSATSGDGTLNSVNSKEEMLTAHALENSWSVTKNSLKILSITRMFSATNITLSMLNKMVSQHGITKTMPAAEPEEMLQLTTNAVEVEKPTTPG